MFGLNAKYILIVVVGILIILGTAMFVFSPLERPQEPQDTDVNTEVNKKSYVHDDFSIRYTEDWYPYENGTGVFFVHDENLQIPPNTDGFALGPFFQVTVHKIGIEEMFAQNLWTEGSEFLVSKEKILVQTDEATRLVTKGAGAEGEVLHYVFESTDGRVFTLSHYPYKAESKDTDDFEEAVRTFMIGMR